MFNTAQTIEFIKDIAETAQAESFFVGDSNRRGQGAPPENF
jgi:hypothetical protein